MSFFFHPLTVDLAQGQSFLFVARRVLVVTLFSGNDSEKKSSSRIFVKIKLTPLRKSLSYPLVRLLYDADSILSVTQRLFSWIPVFQSLFQRSIFTFHQSLSTLTVLSIKCKQHQYISILQVKTSVYYSVVVPSWRTISQIEWWAV